MVIDNLVISLQTLDQKIPMTNEVIMKHGTKTASRLNIPH